MGVSAMRGAGLPSRRAGVRPLTADAAQLGSGRTTGRTPGQSRRCPRPPRLGFFMVMPARVTDMSSPSMGWTGSRGARLRRFAGHWPANCSPGAARCRTQAFQSTSSAGKMGPSLHTCFMVPSAMGMAQPRQAPTPQAIRSSMDTWQGTPNPSACRHDGDRLQHGLGAAGQHGCRVGILLAAACCTTADPPSRVRP